MMRCILSTVLAGVALGSMADNFDVRKKWPGCSSEVLNQGGCGSCWAFGSAEAVSDRFCIKGEKVQLSPQSLVSCSGPGTCKGGAAVNAYKYMATNGLQSCTSACTSGCEPYGSGKKPATCKNDPNNDRCHGCDKQCHNGNKAVFYKVTSFVKSGLDSNEATIMNQLQTHGSVTGGLSVYKNWAKWVKTHGADSVYDSHEGSAHMGAHCIKYIGYGVSQGKKYWLLQNSWGPNFADHGTIKMLRGGSHASGDTQIVWDQAWYATPVLADNASNADALNWSPQDFVNEEDDFVAGAWSRGDASHPEWLTTAQEAMQALNIASQIGRLEQVDTQIVAGYNARFTVITSDSKRMTISASYGPDFDLNDAPQLEHMSSVVV